MKRAGFTMIELIFVIVILGILAAVALPKFAGVASQAQVSKLKAYTGTLNRTVGPALWSEAVTAGTGTVATAANSTEVAAQLPPLTAINDNGSDLTALNMTGCAANGTAIAAGTGSVTTATIDGTTYSIGCIDSDMTESPHFFLDDGTTVLVQ